MFLGNILDIFALKTYDIAKEKRYLKQKTRMEQWRAQLFNNKMNHPKYIKKTVFYISRKRH